MGSGYNVVRRNHPGGEANLLIKLRNASPATPAMFTTQWSSNHALKTEILFIKFPQVEELFYRIFLLVATIELWNIASIFQK